MTTICATFTNYFIYEDCRDFYIKNITGLSLSDGITLTINNTVIFSEHDISLSHFGIMKGKVEISTLSTNKKTIYYIQYLYNEVNMTILPWNYSVYNYNCNSTDNNIITAITPKITTFTIINACFIGFTDDPETLVLCGEMDTEELYQIIKKHNINYIRIYGYTKLLSYLRTLNIKCIKYITH